MNAYQGLLFSEKSRKLKKRKDRILPISIIVKIQNGAMEYGYGRWKKHKKIHVICDGIVGGNFYSLCGIAKEISPILINYKSRNMCIVCGKIYNEICEKI